jgi:hypothetical protein
MAPSSHAPFLKVEHHALRREQAPPIGVRARWMRARDERDAFADGVVRKR